MVVRVGDLAGLWAGLEGTYMDPATFPLAVFWEAAYPVLARLAVARLSAPMSTASVERQVSNGRVVLTELMMRKSTASRGRARKRAAAFRKVPGLMLGEETVRSA